MKRGGRTFQSTPDHEVSCSELMADEERAESEVVVQRIKGGHELGECGDCWELLRELEERLGLTRARHT